jgi:hypothetical protein
MQRILGNGTAPPITTIPDTVDAEGYLNGGSSVASAFAEAFLMQLGGGLPVAWGELNATQVPAPWLSPPWPLAGCPPPGCHPSPPVPGVLTPGDAHLLPRGGGQGAAVGGPLSLLHGHHHPELPQRGPTGTIPPPPPPAPEKALGTVTRPLAARRRRPLAGHSSW